MAAFLACKVQHYPWGQLAHSGLVGKLSHDTSASPCAELWMGTHPSGPSKMKDSNIAFSSWLENKGLPNKLPFLFKVLSVEKALSIQAHPDKALAEQLHKFNPKQYKDDNHKPEMTLALTEFQALCGFRPPHEIANELRSNPEVLSVVSPDIVRALESANADCSVLKNAFSSVFQAPRTSIVEAITALIERVSQVKNPSKRDLLLMKLHRDHPDCDVGLIASMFLRHVTLQPGETVFLPPNVPHAYLHGDCVEIMAESDNVVRAGLTGKFIDAENLTTMLTYDWEEPNYVHEEAIEGWPGFGIFRPPHSVLEFELRVAQIQNEKISVAPLSVPSLWLCLEGSATITLNSVETKISQGSVFCVLPGRNVHISSASCHLSVALEKV